MLKEYRKAKRDKIWCIRLSSNYNKRKPDMRKRGNNVASVDVTQCSEWLDLLPENSGVYACHGTLSCVEPIQLIELAIGLESSKRPFIWVIRQGYKSDELNKLWRLWVRKWMEKEKREMEHGVLAIENNGASYINLKR
ncbi:hypothetical protein Gotur_020099 [Gossypium turneri]